MAKRQLELTEKEIGQFRAAETQTRDVYELKRLQAVRLYGTGMPLVAIQDMTGAGESTIRQWAMAYRAEGLTGLCSKWSSKNANKLTDEQRAQIKQRLHEYRPVDLHVSTGEYWTVSDLRVAVEQWFGVIYQDETSYQTLFRKSGFSYQRTTKVYRSRPSEAALAQFESELEKK
ncbi:MAG: helix-turn-helix domain-containing protein [Anaerolineae bacterium]|nr:helix-turn-helix domain-containing protein [Anaerolineae bacterium]